MSEQEAAKQEIFVFGSNLKGIHGSGAALFAKRKYGAEMGQGVGPTGNAYAIPTKRHPYESLSLDEIRPYVHDFIHFAIVTCDRTFILTRIGCGLAGYTDSQIAPMFVEVPYHVIVPVQWEPYFEQANKFKVQYHERS